MATMLDRVTQGSLLQMHPPGDNGWNVDLEWGYRSAFLKGSLRTLPRLRGGGGGIRTHETLAGLTVFKTAGFNRSPTPPN